MERDQREGRILLPRLKRLRELGDPKRNVSAPRRKDLAGHWGGPGWVWGPGLIPSVSRWVTRTR